MTNPGVTSWERLSQAGVQTEIWLEMMQNRRSCVREVTNISAPASVWRPLSSQIARVTSASRCEAMAVSTSSVTTLDPSSSSSRRWGSEDTSCIIGLRVRIPQLYSCSSSRCWQCLAIRFKPVGLHCSISSVRNRNLNPQCRAQPTVQQQ
jgi:hypothetical protein